MRAEYKRDMNHNYLILHEDMELDTSSYQVRMLVGNVIPSLLKCQFHGVDGKIVFHYDITSKQSLAVLYEGKLLKEEDLRIIFGSFVQVMEQMAEYLLNPGQVLLQPEYMYMDANKKEIFYCYLPGKEREVKEQFQSLTEYILPKIDHGDEKAVMLGYGVYRQAMEESFHLEHVKGELFRERKEDEKGESIGSVSGEYKKYSKNSEFPEEVEASAEDGLEALFGMSNSPEAEKVKKTGSKKQYDKKNYGKKKNNKKNQRKEEKKVEKQGQLQQKIYIIVPIVGTIVIMSILAANMLGILPWLRVELLLMAVVVAAMIASFICYLVGKVQSKKKREENDRQWKEKVRRFRENEDRVDKFEQDKQLMDMENNVFGREMIENDAMRNDMLQNNIIRNDVMQNDVMRNNIIQNSMTQKDFMRKSVNRNSVEENIEYSDERKNRINRQADYGETVVLSANTVRGPASLVSKEPGELATIYLKDDLTVIGKLETAADAVISLPTISRLHAKIRKRGDDYYLADLNSRNGTSVNGRMLKVNEEYLLQDEDEVDFAEARYIFLK